MKAILFEEFGEPEVLTLGEVPEPELRSSDLLVRVHAAGINRADLQQRRGAYGRPDYGDSMLMGLEIAGEVIALGADTNGFQIGDRVMGIVGGGAYAEVARIDYRMAMPIPIDIDYVHAAAIPEVFVTAHEALLHLGRLKAGETVLIHAASGGVGSAAVQLAHAVGARIIATTKADKHGRVVELGADTVVDYQTQNFADVVASQTGGRGLDVVIDFIGAPYFERNVLSLAEGGRLIQDGTLGGIADAKIPLDRLLFRHLQIIGTVMKSRSQETKQGMVQRFRDKWLPHFRQDGLEPVLDSVFPLAKASEAHRHMETGDNMGKIILSMDVETI